MTKGLVFDIRRFSVHDGPGIRTTVFLKGCPLRCKWCHNPEGLSPEPQTMLRKRMIESTETICKEIAGQWYRPDEVMRKIMKDQLFFEESHGGVTFSGGEPLMQPDFLKEVLMLCSAIGVHTIVDTAGITDRQTFHSVAIHTDMLLYDIKCINSALHEKYTGLGNEETLSNLRSLEEIPLQNNDNLQVIIRIPYIPGFNDTAEEIEAICRYIVSLQIPIRQVELLPYHNLGRQKYAALGLPVPHQIQSTNHSITVDEVCHIFNHHGINIYTHA